MSTSFATLLANVYTLTNRPDLVNETTLAVQNATLKCHRSDYYYKDILEVAVACDFALTNQSIQYKTLIPQWRSSKYIRVYDYSIPPGAPSTWLTKIEPENVLDDYNNDKYDVYYIAGANINIQTAAAAQYFLIGCYIYPYVDTVRFSSWIADEHPEAIMYEAASIVFKAIGYDEQSDKFHNMHLSELQDLKQQIIAEGC